MYLPKPEILYDVIIGSRAERNYALVRIPSYGEQNDRSRTSSSAELTAKIHTGDRFVPDVPIKDDQIIRSGKDCFGRTVVNLRNVINLPIGFDPQQCSPERDCKDLLIVDKYDPHLDFPPKIALGVRQRCIA